MPDQIAAPSPAAAPVIPVAGISDGKKSGNVSLTRVAQMLQASPPAEGEKIAGDAAPPAKTGESTPAAEVPGTSRATETPPQTGTPPATPTEEPAAPAEGGEEVETPTDLSQLSNLDPKTKELVESLLKKQKEHTQELIDKRIGKEVAKRKTLEEQLASLRQQAPAVPQIPSNGMLPSPTPPQAIPVPVGLSPTETPLADIHDVNTLQAKRNEADGFRQKADDALALGPDGNGHYEIDGEALTKEQVIMVRRNATNIVNNQVPQRFQFLQTRHAAVQQAYTEFPWMKDQQSPEYQQAASILNSTPWLRNMPNAELIIGYHLEGQKAMAERRKAATAPAKPAAKPKPPSDQTALGGGSGAPGRASAETRAQEHLSIEIGKLGSKGRVSIRDAAAFLQRKDQLSQSR